MIRISTPEIGKGGGRQGFTLLEIMLVVVILSVFAGAIVTNMSAGYRSIALDNDADLLLRVVSSAQRYSLANRRICRLTIDMNENDYYLTSAAERGEPFLPLQGEIGGTVRLSTGITFAEITKIGIGAGDNTLIHFFPDGTSEPAYIVLTARPGDEREIEIHSLFGKGRLE